MTLGFDYAFAPHPAPAVLKQAGASFVARYVSSLAANDANGKNLLSSELAGLLNAGLSVVLVAEEGGSRMLSGRPAGIADATHADAVARALKMAGIPVYFACDFDATPAQQAPINAYLQGAASVIGVLRVGIYGGYYPVGRALDAGTATYAWQTEAWSGGQWDSRAQIRQYAAPESLGGAQVDRNDARAADYGQWPRPAAPVPSVPVPVAPAGHQFTVTVPALSLGQSGNWVRTLQALLGPRRGHDILIDGDFGQDTQALLRQVQAITGLPQTGVVDEATWKALLSGL